MDAQRRKVVEKINIYTNGIEFIHSLFVKKVVVLDLFLLQNLEVTGGTTVRTLDPQSDSTRTPTFVWGRQQLTVIWAALF